MAFPRPWEEPVMRATLPRRPNFSSRYEGMFEAAPASLPTGIWTAGRMPALLQSCERHGVHVRENLIVTAHGPNEAIRSRARATMDGPGRREDCLAITHDQMPRGVRFAHEMEDDVITDI